MAISYKKVQLQINARPQRYSDAVNQRRGRLFKTGSGGPGVYLSLAFIGGITVFLHCISFCFLLVTIIVTLFCSIFVG